MAQARTASSTLESAKSLPLSCVNHISRVCADVIEAEEFYVNVLGFVQVKRPGSFNFDGAWLFNYGIGIHLLQSESGEIHSVKCKEIDPKSDHISFQCEDIDLVEAKLKENGIKYLRSEVEEGGILVDQIFFHDPDGFMIEVCNCDLLPVVPLGPAARLKNHQQRFASCKRSSSRPTGMPIVIAPDCPKAPQSYLQVGNQIGHEDFAIC